MPRYAENTKVASRASRDEIERTLARYGADGFMYGWADDSAIVAFRMNNRHIKFVLPLPARADFEKTPTGLERSQERRNAAHEQASRQRWRALALVIKAKLEAVEAAIVSFESEFLAQIVLPDGKTVGEVMVPQVGIAYDSGDMPPLLGYAGRS